jgi:vancomycin resistance protein YoaR
MLARAEHGEKYVPLLLRVNPQLLQAALRRIAPRFQRSPHDARPYLLQGRVRIAPDLAGRELNLGAAVPRVTQSLEEHPGETTLQVPVRLQVPRLTRDRLRGITAVTGAFTTRFNPGNIKRTHNMMVAIRSINGTLLSPGEVFSLNQTVGDRTQARGYRTAIIFKNGYKVAGIGGGVSQVTGTLFNAALVAGLPIVTYRTHSQPVKYLPIGRDATVSWGNFDMKFRNSTGAPIYISYQRQGNTLTARLFGTKKTERVKIHVSAKRLGPRHIEAKLFRKFIGTQTRTETVGSSTYQWKESDWMD